MENSVTSIAIRRIANWLRRAKCSAIFRAATAQRCRLTGEIPSLLTVNLEKVN